MAKSQSVTIEFAVDTSRFDAAVERLRLLFSQLGFALDNYLASGAIARESDDHRGEA